MEKLKAVEDYQMEQTELDNELIGKVWEQTRTHGIHYGNCESLVLRGKCTCMANFEIGYILGLVVRLTED
jgi:hypothetical protein